MHVMVLSFLTEIQSVLELQYIHVHVCLGNQLFGCHFTVSIQYNSLSDVLLHVNYMYMETNYLVKSLGFILLLKLTLFLIILIYMYQLFYFTSCVYRV